MQLHAPCWFCSAPLAVADTLKVPAKLIACCFLASCNFIAHFTLLFIRTLIGIAIVPIKSEQFIKTVCAAHAIPLIHSEKCKRRCRDASITVPSQQRQVYVVDCGCWCLCTLSCIVPHWCGDLWSFRSWDRNHWPWTAWLHWSIKSIGTPRYPDSHTHIPDINTPAEFTPYCFLCRSILLPCCTRVEYCHVLWSSDWCFIITQWYPLTLCYFVICTWVTSSPRSHLRLTQSCLATLLSYSKLLTSSAVTLLLFSCTWTTVVDRSDN